MLLDPPSHTQSRERWCRLTLRVLAFAFAWGGVQFLFFPDSTVRTITAVGTWLGDFAPAPPSALRFWLTLATGYMALVTALAYLAQRDLQRHRDLLALLVFGKATTSLVAIGFYVFSSPAFIYLVNFAVDGLITLVVFAIWLVVPSLGTRTEAGGGRSDDVLRALAEAMVPSGGPFPEGACELGTAQNIDAFVAGTSPAASRALAFALRLLEWFPFFISPLRMRRFTRLSIDERAGLLDAWERSRLRPLRQLIHSLKLLVMTNFYSRPEIERRLGYPDPLQRVPRTSS